MDLDTMGLEELVISVPETPIDNVQVQTILESALAPREGISLTPWEYVFLDDEESYDKLREIYPYSKMLDVPSFAIIVCRATQYMPWSESKWRVKPTPEMIDLIGHMSAYGLSGVWLGAAMDVVRCEYLKKHFHLPSYVEAIAVIAVGTAIIEQPEHVRILDEKIAERYRAVSSE